ncbi:MAG: hypothetical protein K2X39_07875 [Silvanigrellaceae bacterium]|nr:hypothetical protein [Silvanigrellaceae bacterium]
MGIAKSRDLFFEAEKMESRIRQTWFIESLCSSNQGLKQGFDNYFTIKNFEPSSSSISPEQLNIKPEL